MAAQRAMIDTLLASLKQAGLKVSGVDVSSLALVRALVPDCRLPGRSGAEPGSAAGIVDISSSVSTLVVAIDDVLKFTRVINFSSDRFAKVIAEQRGIPFDDASAVGRRSVGLPGPSPPRAGSIRPRSWRRPSGRPASCGRRAGGRDPPLVRLLPGPGGRHAASRSSS